MSVTPSVSSSTSSFPMTTVQKQEYISQQLVFLLHAKKCTDEVKTNDLEEKKQRPCTLPHCQQFQNVLKHMEGCRVFTKCEFEYCTSSRQIIRHWKECKKETCQVCAPIRHYHKPYDPNKIVEIPVDAPHYFYL